MEKLSVYVKKDNSLFNSIIFLILGVICFYKFYYLYFNRWVIRIMNRNYKCIEMFKNTLYNHLKRMGGIFSGRSRKKRKEDCADS